MPGRDTPGSRDPDDWFDDLDAADTRRERPVKRSAAASGRGYGNLTLPAFLSDRRVAIAIGVVLAVLLIVGGLALAGAFSGSKKQPAVTTPTIVSTPTTTAPTTPPAPTVSAPTTTLKPGDTGPQVRALQRALAHLGYSPGKVDGDYGAATTSAVKQFQTASKLTADGIFGPATRTAMVTALK